MRRFLLLALAACAGRPARATAMGAQTLHGGGVLLGNVTAYVIFYGSWGESLLSAASATKHLLQGIGATPYWSTVTGYPGATSAIRCGGAFAADASLFGADVWTNRTGIQELVVLLSLQVNLSLNTIPIIVLSEELLIDPSECATHDYATWEANAKNFTVPWIIVRNSSECFPPVPWTAASTTLYFASRLVHELAETVVDPLYTGYYSGSLFFQPALEIGDDPCNNAVVPYADNPNGYCVTNNTIWNVNVSGSLYLLQGLWDNETAQCSVGASSLACDPVEEDTPSLVVTGCTPFTQSLCGAYHRMIAGQYSQAQPGSLCEGSPAYALGHPFAATTMLYALPGFWAINHATSFGTCTSQVYVGYCFVPAVGPLNETGLRLSSPSGKPTAWMCVTSNAPTYEAVNITLTWAAAPPPPHPETPSHSQPPLPPLPKPPAPLPYPKPPVPPLPPPEPPAPPPPEPPAPSPPKPQPPPSPKPPSPPLPPPPEPPSPPPPEPPSPPPPEPPSLPPPTPEPRAPVPAPTLGFQHAPVPASPPPEPALRRVPPPPPSPSPRGGRVVTQRSPPPLPQLAVSAPILHLPAGGRAPEPDAAAPEPRRELDVGLIVGCTLAGAVVLSASVLFSIYWISSSRPRFTG